ncbi:peptidase M28 family protein [Sphingorhabdus sp. IMCC26285]|uniref:Carboxypeptidase Q n=1 Tax=Sphingorhabdus profundilacus TaxID=2509718 RepID=A0A6I4LXZ5_9SPHN|nr:M28 family peptidase [Sphingorhabdus profundilacus]MVZ96910.1 peptidase M28 family protein [Sphingorhabdus profundilacus]
MNKHSRSFAAASMLLISATYSVANAQSTLSDARESVLKSDEVAYDVIEGLTTEIGPRQGGTEAEARARIWAVNKLKALGFENVRIEEFKMPTWVRGEEKAEISSPFRQKLAITALGNSGSTGEAGLEAEIAYFPTLDDLRVVPDGSLKGKIAFVSHAMHRTQDGSSYAAFGPARFVGPNIAAKKGAAAIIIRSAGTDYHRNPHTGNTNFEAGVTPIPSGAISIPDAENLERMLGRGKAITMKLKLTPQNIGMQTSGNVLAEIPGSNPKLPIIVIACHLDSWDLGTGAIDDAAGCGIITAAAKHLKTLGQPKRTVRLLWAGAEEVGVWGGKDYGAQHATEGHGLAMESDFGAGNVWAVDFLLPESASELKRKIVAALAPLGVVPRKNVAAGGADIGAIIAAQKPGIIDLQQDGTKYFDLHHTPDDTLDKIDKAELRQNVAAWVSTLALVANYEGPLNPEPMP